MKNLFGYKELHSISGQLDGMLVKHVEWLSALHKVIICKLPPDLLKRGHRECDFGKWYYSVDTPLILESPDFVSLGVSHTKLHKIANQILDQYENNETPTEEEYELFVDSEKEFFALLNKFIDNVLATKNQFDYLTNIPNRSLVTLMLKKEYSKFLRSLGSEYSIAFADIDNFKTINDTYGHAAGDNVLTILSALFSEKIRPYDIIGRFGGEEFIFCFPQTSIDSTTKILERIRSELEASKIKINHSKKVHVTCSFGVSMLQADTSLEESIKQADKALYLAKSTGRNKVEVWAK